MKLDSECSLQKVLLMERCDVDWKHVIRGAIDALIGRIGGHTDGRKGIVKVIVGGRFAPKN